MRRLLLFRNTVCGLFLPAKSRSSYYALRALNVELASIKDSRKATQNPNNPDSVLALQLRMQWWRGALDSMYSTNEAIDPAYTKSPVVRALYQAHNSDGGDGGTVFTKRFLERLVDAREADLSVKQYATMSELQTYSDETACSLLYLSLDCVGVRDDEADEVAMLAGRGIGLVTALRATPYVMPLECPLPAEFLPKFFSFTNEWSEDDKEIFDEAVRFVAHTAQQNLMEARKLQAQMPVKAVLLPAIPAILYLEELEKTKHNIFAAQDINRRKLFFQLGRTWLTGVF